jgi:hypothetical protein
MVKSGEFTRVDVDDAARNLKVVLRKQGIHRNPDIDVEISSRLTPEDIEELQAQGHIEEDASITHYKTGSSIQIDKADQLSPQQIDTAIAIAGTLATLRELDSARVDIMGTYMFGDYQDYVASTVILVRQS